MRILLLLLLSASLSAQFIPVDNGGGPKRYTLSPTKAFTGVWDLPELGPRAFSPMTSPLNVEYVFASGGDVRSQNDYYLSDGGRTLLTVSETSVSVWDMSGTEIVADASGQYRVARMSDLPPMTCEMLDAGPKSGGQEKASGGCVELYFEVDHSTFVQHGQNTVAFIDALLTQVMIVLRSQGVDVEIAEVFIWDRPSPYDAQSAAGRLYQFVSQRPTGSFSGQLAHLISSGPQGAGGVAFVDVLCHPSVRHAFSRIYPTFNDVPVYSWNVLVILHETGHNLGSPHTHDCAWNGNNTPIDGCSDTGQCEPGPIPTRGTIMSYCHLRSGVGIDFSLGYGDQPRDLIQTKINTASCLVECRPGDEDETGVCEQYEVIVSAVLGCRPEETTLYIAGLTYGPFDRDAASFSDTLCLAQDCYTLIATDSYGDGMDGRITLTADGQQYVLEVIGDRGEVEVCLGVDPPEDVCSVDLSTFSEFGITQDEGWVFEQDGVLHLRGNAWAEVMVDTMELSEGLLLGFWMRSTVIGEIGGVGVSYNSVANWQRVYNIYGTQAYGRRGYGYDHGTWQWYELPVGDDLSGQMDRILFVADADVFKNAQYEFYGVQLGRDCIDPPPPPADLHQVFPIEGRYDMLGRPARGDTWTFGRDGLRRQ